MKPNQLPRFVIFSAFAALLLFVACRKTLLDPSSVREPQNPLTFTTTNSGGQIDISENVNKAIADNAFEFFSTRNFTIVGISDEETSGNKKISQITYSVQQGANQPQLETALLVKED